MGIVLATMLCLPASAQTGTRIMAGSASNDRTGFSWETRLEPPSPPLASTISGGVVGGNSTHHRYMADSSQHKYFGYDLQIEPLPQANTYRVTFRPLTTDKLRNGFAGWALIPLPAYPAPQTVHGGDTIALDLFTNPATGQKIVDYIRIQDKRREFVAGNSGPARDFSVSDVELRLASPRITVNGTLHPATAGETGGVSGAAVWFYLPDHGRYFLSLAPHPELGFQKAGEVRGSRLSFTAGGETIEMDCNGRIAPGYAPYNLYVLAEPGWRPADPNGRNTFGMTAGDRIESLLHR